MIKKLCKIRKARQAKAPPKYFVKPQVTSSLPAAFFIFDGFPLNLLSHFRRFKGKLSRFAAFIHEMPRRLAGKSGKLTKCSQLASVWSFARESPFEDLKFLHFKSSEEVPMSDEQRERQTTENFTFPQAPINYFPLISQLSTLTARCRGPPFLNFVFQKQIRQKRRLAKWQSTNITSG